MITTVKITQFGHRPSWKQYALCLVIAITFCQLSANSTVTAATYYLDTNGSDNANGLSVGTAWKTIARALPNWSGTGSKVTSGDTVILKAGNYGGFEANNVSGTGWITYKADVNLTAVFDRIYVINHSRSNVYFRFDGIRVQHPSTYWPTPNGLWHSQDPLAPGNVVQISNANYVQLLNGKYSGYEKYISRGVYVEYSDYVTIDKCEVTCTRDGIEGNSCIGFILRNCHVHNMSEGSGIRVENTATGSRFENNHVHDQHPHNDAEIATATTNDRYFPYKESTDYAFHPGSGFSIRSSDIVIRNNMLHDGFSQGIMFYNGYTYHNITVENNLFYDTGPIKFLLIDGPVTIRNNTFVGCISLEGTGMYDLIQRYSGTPFEMSFSGSFDGKSVVVTNNIVVGHGTLPSTSLAYTENYNLYWKTMNSDNQIITPKGSRSLQAIWLAGSDLHGYPNNFEDTGFIGTTAEYNYSRDGIRRFFINPGYYTNDYSPALDGGTGKTYDYHLASNSSGINYGDATNQPSDSLGSIGGDGFINNDGPTRDSSHHSVGCYEFSGSVPNPEPNNPNPPNADAGPDQTATASAASGTALVTLDGSHSSSPDGSIVSYVWTERGGQIAAVATPTVPLSIGQHTITLQVTDGSGLTDTDTVVITVEEMTADITPPSIISVTASESSVEIQFSEPLDGASAGSAGNYGLSDSIKINYVWLDTGHNRVVLYTNMQTDGKTYALNVANVKDAAGNPMAQTSVTYICNSGLAGYYLFSDAGNSYVFDSSGHNNTGYYINGAHRTDQQEAALGGGDDAVQISTVDWNAAQGTVALWINATSMLGTQYIFGHSVGSSSNLIQLYTDNGYLCVGMGDNHLLKTSIQLLSPQTWYHIALSWDGANYTVYVNGSLSATGTYTGLTLLSSLADIGNTGDTTSRTEGFQGLIDEVRIYNRALAAAEVSNLALVFLPIGDKTVAEGNELSFAIRTRPDITVTLADSNLPSLPSFASNTFRWTPGYTNAGTYEVEFTAPHGTSTDFEKVAITVTDKSLPDNNYQPIGYWKFDETSGDIASDSSATGNTGYLKNGLTWGTGKINGAIVFSVPNDAVEIRTTNFNLQQGTIAMWVYVQRQTLSRHYFFGHVTDTTNRIQLYDKYGYLCLGLGDSHETSVNIQRLQNKRWYHIVLTWNKPTYNVYVNGVLKTSGTYSGLAAFADHADIGNNGFGRDMGLNGKIDDVQIYNRVLNADEIIRLDVGY